MKRIPSTLNQKEQDILINQPNKNAPTGLRNYTLIVVLLSTGLRCAELISLKWDEVDFFDGKIFVKCGKGQRDRILWLNPKALDALHNLKCRFPAQSENVFSTLEGKPLQPRYVRAAVKRYATRANICKNVHPHTLRHTFATDLLDKTNNIRLVQKALGHSSITTTMIYTHIADKQLENALKNFKEPAFIPAAL